MTVALAALVVFMAVMLEWTLVVTPVRISIVQLAVTVDLDECALLLEK